MCGKEQEEVGKLSRDIPCNFFFLSLTTIRPMPYFWLHFYVKRQSSLHNGGKLFLKEFYLPRDGNRICGNQIRTPTFCVTAFSVFPKNFKNLNYATFVECSPVKKLPVQSAPWEVIWRVPCKIHPVKSTLQINYRLNGWLAIGKKDNIFEYTLYTANNYCPL